jgi:hypothetical protein
MKWVIIITMLSGQSYGFPTLNASTCQTALERIVENAKKTGFRFRHIHCRQNPDQPEKADENKKPDLSV